MTSSAEQRRLAAIMFTDMVGYTALAQRNEALALELLEEHRRILRSIFPRFNGTEIKTIGDAFLVEFQSALEAAQCALEIQRTLAKRNHDVSREHRIELRIGIHVGDVVHREGDVYGDGVNIASRIQPVAGIGGICISVDVERQIHHALDARFEKLAPIELKNVQVPMDLFRIVLPWEPDTRLKAEPQKPEVRQRRSIPGGWLVAALLLLGVIGGGIFIFQLVWSSARSHLEGGAPGTPPTQGLAGARPSIPEKSIAVLPFENLSRDPDNAYFADGIQDEILTKLASIADLKVISRTSTAKYKSKPEDLTTVSQQLGVAKVLEGSVQKAADKVRVNVQLIDARADSHLWAKTYDRDIKDVFAVESEVAQEIADSLQAKLSPVEASTLATAPTKDPAAHDLFLKGEHEERLAESSLKAESYEQAAAWYQQAIARDSNFALAMARLVENRMEVHWFFEHLSEAELAQVRSMAEHALALAPNLAEVHVALGDFYYHGYRQYEPALAEFERGLQLQPNSSTALSYLAYVHRRQGQWERCLDEFKKALEQDPRNAKVAGDLPTTQISLRMWKVAAGGAGHALEIDPHATESMRTLLESILAGSGDINEAQRVLATFPTENKIFEGSNYGHLRDMTGERAYVSVCARDFNAAVKVCEAAGNSASDERRHLSARVAIRLLAGDLVGARAEAEKARPLLEERLRDRPNDISSMPQLSWVYLALKRNSDAIKLARQASNLLPPEKDALVGNDLLTGLAEIEARTGATADAIAILRQQLSVPAGGSVSIARLKIDPVWDPIRNDPGFQQLLAGTEHVGP